MIRENSGAVKQRDWGLLCVVFSVRPGPFHLDPRQSVNQVL